MAEKMTIWTLTPSMAIAEHQVARHKSYSQYDAYTTDAGRTLYSCEVYLSRELAMAAAESKVAAMEKKIKKMQATLRKRKENLAKMKGAHGV